MLLSDKFLDDFLSELDSVIDDNVKYEVSDIDVIVYLDEEDDEMFDKIIKLATKYCYTYEIVQKDNYLIIKLTQTVW